ncbi:MAG: lipid IV(A) 3-deoxy-D-manno-octulosonic acid transferase [Proteobacteria bacterium]|nr:lipid IV(A) 3-deoxy-D-manno-octulosonic acid transferase [Pseudomonadota bacterium]
MLLRRLYIIFSYFLPPFLIMRLLWRSRKNPAYRKRLGERFGCFEATNKAQGIWVHAISLGEVIAATPLIKRLQQQYPDKQITVTTMSVTGSDRVKAAFGDSVFHVYVPYDFPDAIARFLNRIRPVLAVFVETELWPNTLAICHARKIPTIIANARLSQKSVKGYAFFPSIAHEMMQYVTLVAAQTQMDADRYINLGLNKSKVKITSSVKFDITIPENIPTQGQALRTLWGEQRPVLIAASTHEGEEDLILTAFSAIREKVPNALLILVPRHPERFEKVTQLCRSRNFQTALRSEQQSCNENTAVFLGNTMGELLLFYAASDVAFVGGSLIPRGGHNLLEPAALQKPVLTGTHNFNFTEIFQLLKNDDAVFQVHTANELANTVTELFQNPQSRNDAGKRAQEVVIKNRGAVDAHMKIFAEYLN